MPAFMFWFTVAQLVSLTTAMILGTRWHLEERRRYLQPSRDNNATQAARQRLRLIQTDLPSRYSRLQLSDQDRIRLLGQENAQRLPSSSQS